MYTGKRKETFGLADSTLGVGPYSWSGNAMPVPKVQIGFPNWTPLLNDRLAFQAIWAHGWLDDRTAFVRRTYLHQKTFYARLGYRFFSSFLRHQSSGTVGRLCSQSAYGPFTHANGVFSTRRLPSQRRIRFLERGNGWAREKDRLQSV
ncbi:hypothetical protein [Siphonobacter curvatus]|uniref:hypothetical protein n=1 Tax=Siphonobacter curvatus TaxID=2094562 RepID=UPI000D52A200|nr:hypothetical protein [Siphonobacter curvatus]